MRSHGLGRKDLQRKKDEEEDKGERKLTGASRNGGCRYGKNKYCGYDRSRRKRYGMNGCYGYGRSRHSYACCDSWPLKSLCKQGDRHTDETQIHIRKKKVNLAEKKRRHIPIKSGLGGALFSSSKSEILFFKIGALLGSSRMSLDPSEDKSILGPRVAELGMEEGVTTREAPPFAAWEIAAKGSLVEITSGKTEGAVLV